VRFILVGFIYLMFFLSGAAALMYQVLWVRSLSLIFGGSHLAVAAVLSIFMAGLAIGGYIIGKSADSMKKPLRIYGFLELLIGIFAIIFLGLIKLYPYIYIPLAQGRDEHPVYLFLIRIIFSIVALIVPTSLMGGTLPVLSRFISGRPDNLRSHLSFLYGLNTLGAVAGAIAAGFFFLRFYSVSTTMGIAILTNLFIGLSSILLQDKAALVLTNTQAEPLLKKKTAKNISRSFAPEKTNENLFSFKLVLWGIGVSGFCALGYEVLWTRILAIVFGASVYGFTTMLAAFLTGIAVGSGAYGILPKIFPSKGKEIETSIVWFGIVQVIIGISSLVVTAYIHRLPLVSFMLRNYLQQYWNDFFKVKISTNFTLAFFYMFFPAFFMGLAFPIAGRVHAVYKKMVGSAVGEVLAYNTIGAILGAALSGFVMIYFFGIEKSLQMLTVINIVFGLLVAFSVKNNKMLNWSFPIAGFVILLFLGINHNALRIWDLNYFAIFRSNQPEAFDTPEKIKDAVENTDVLYYAEGAESIVSSIKVKGGYQSFITNGRVEATTSMEGQQCQFMLGHLPMLLARNPKKVLLIGTGSGMTLGATSVYPSVEEITLVEIEPKVIGVAKTFGNYNHHVLENPKLKIVFNDGRNFLMTTKNRYDVITADPVHPWFRGAGYLYTSEYFKLASEHLEPGGIMCHWLPIYELTTENIKSVVKTFTENFKYTMLWLTYDDAELVGSNSPITIDENELERRFSRSEISADMKRISISSSTDLLSYFVMGSTAMRNFSKGGVVNTDDNLYLEFSAPFSIGKNSLMEDNANAIADNVESVLPYLVPMRDEKMRAEQIKNWGKYSKAFVVARKAQALFLGGKYYSPEFNMLMEELNNKYPWLALYRLLKSEYTDKINMEPRLLQNTSLVFLDKTGARIVIELSAVLVPVSNERAAIVFADNASRVIYGQLYVNGLNMDRFINGFVNDVMINIRSAYKEETEIAFRKGKEFPSAETGVNRIKKIITEKIHEKGEAGV